MTPADEARWLEDGQAARRYFEGEQWDKAARQALLYGTGFKVPLFPLPRGGKSIFDRMSGPPGSNAPIIVKTLEALAKSKPGMIVEVETAKMLEIPVLWIDDGPGRALPREQRLLLLCR